MNKGPNATIRLVRRQNHAGTTVSWTTVQREKSSHAYKLSSNVQTACSTDSLNNCPKHSILRFSSFALKIYLWLKMCQHNLPCSIVLPTACFPEGPSPHFTFCSFWRRRQRLEAVQEVSHFSAGNYNFRKETINTYTNWDSQIHLLLECNYYSMLISKCFFCGSFMLFLSCFVMLSWTSVWWCLVVTCWERADLLALVCDV